MMALSMAGLAVGETKPVLYVAIALVGYGNSNIFSLVFSQAILSDRKRQNEISGLMIMGLFGGTIFPLLMGVASDAIDRWGPWRAWLAAWSISPFTVSPRCR
jgi:fucose permease